jgi:endonuclease/exonuclease/phosphatase family metal-dependent hydrolase
MFARTRTIRSKTQTQKSNKTTDFDEIQPLNIVSWNISSAEPSQAAPNRADRFQNASHLIRDEVLRHDNPHVIALQETASPTHGSEIFWGYISTGTRMALHTREYIDLMIRRDAFATYERIAFPDLPAVGALLMYHGAKLAIVAVHLPHTKEAAPLRKQLCQSIVQHIESRDVDDIILIGDFNMRKDEDKSVEQMAGGLTDAWKEAANSDKSKMFTWNGRENLYHGPDNFQFTARFDRCYIRGDNIRLRRFELVGNRTVEREGDYLSDHYGMYVGCDVVISETNGTSQAKATTGSLIGPSRSTGHRLDGGNASVSNMRQISAQELRLIRLQRSESISATSRSEPVTESTQSTYNSIVDLTGDSDDEKETLRPRKKARGM